MNFLVQVFPPQLNPTAAREKSIRADLVRQQNEHGASRPYRLCQTISQRALCWGYASSSSPFRSSGDRLPPVVAEKAGTPGYPHRRGRELLAAPIEQGADSEGL